MSFWPILSQACLSLCLTDFENRNGLFVNPLRVFVELAGIEPASKQGTHRVSTCLAVCWFSNPGWQTAADRSLIPCFLAGITGKDHGQS